MRTVIVAVAALALLGGCSFLPKKEIPVFVKEPVAIECPNPDLPQRPAFVVITEADRKDEVISQITVRLNALALEQLTSYADQLENLLQVYKSQNAVKNEQVKKMHEDAQKKMAEETKRYESK